MTRIIVDKENETKVPIITSSSRKKKKNRQKPKNHKHLIALTNLDENILDYQKTEKKFDTTRNVQIQINVQPESTVTNTELKYIVIDGSNVAMA